MNFNASNNPLLEPFYTPFNSIPFAQIRPIDFEPAIEQSIQAAKEEIQLIVDNEAEPTFANTLIALERAGKRLHIIASTFFNLHSAETNDELQQAAQKISPLMAAYGNDIILNEKLFARVKIVYETVDRQLLTIEDIRLLDKTYADFTRNGALLTDEQKTRLRKIDQELSELKVQFSQNILQETNAFMLHLKQEEELDGIPVSIREMAAEEAAKRHLTGWVFTLHHPSYVPFMKYAQNRELRERMYLAAASKAFQANKYNNTANIKHIVALRQERAALLGYQHHAEFVLQERMAGSAARVEQFLQTLLFQAKPFAEREIAALKTLAEQDGIAVIMPYDHAYYAEKLREQRYDFSEEALRPYFSLQQVIEAAFQVANKLYGLTFMLRCDIPTYHDEVSVYEVLEGGKHKALLYTDWHPRSGKRAGAWMTSFRGQYRIGDQNVRPHVSIVCNFSRPTADIPSLLTFSEVTTLFHEFGHALHGILADTVYESLSGTHVFWDFVELPSQFMENYCYESELLNVFAKHYHTGESLPETECAKIIESANFMEGYQTLRQLGFGLLDMAYHTNQLTDLDDVESFENKAIAATQLYPHVQGTAQSPSFSHIFPGGYAAGYYSYKWAEVLDADAFAYFKEQGIFNPVCAEKFKHLLSQGGTIDPMELYTAFRGRKPENEALLTRAGLTD